MRVTVPKKLKLDAERVWFTADTHFGHANVLRYCDRPFDDVAAHDAALVAGARACLNEDSILVHLGDVAFGHGPGAAGPIADLPGRKILVAGNHDSPAVLYADVWSEVCTYRELVLHHQGQDRFVVASHFPLAVWNRSRRGAVHVHGHCHGRLPAVTTSDGGRLDVGVDCWGYRPVRLVDVLDRLAAVRAGASDGRAEYARRRGIVEAPARNDIPEDPAPDWPGDTSY